MSSTNASEIVDVETNLSAPPDDLDMAIPPYDEESQEGPWISIGTILTVMIIFLTLLCLANILVYSKRARDMLRPLYNAINIQVLRVFWALYSDDNESPPSPRRHNRNDDSVQVINEMLYASPFCCLMSGAHPEPEVEKKKNPEVTESIKEQKNDKAKKVNFRKEQIETSKNGGKVRQEVVEEGQEPERKRAVTGSIKEKKSNKAKKVYLRKEMIETTKDEGKVRQEVVEEGEESERQRVVTGSFKEKKNDKAKNVNLRKEMIETSKDEGKVRQEVVEEGEESERQRDVTGSIKEKKNDKAKNVNLRKEMIEATKDEGKVGQEVVEEVEGSERQWENNVNVHDNEKLLKWKTLTTVREECVVEMETAQSNQPGEGGWPVTNVIEGEGCPDVIGAVLETSKAFYI